MSANSLPSGEGGGRGLPYFCCKVTTFIFAPSTYLFLLVSFGFFSVQVSEDVRGKIAHGALAGHPDGDIRTIVMYVYIFVKSVRFVVYNNYAYDVCFFLNTNCTNRTNLASRFALAGRPDGTYER